MVDKKEIMDIKELSSYIGLSRSKIYQLIKEKKIPASKIGRQYKFSKELIDTWLKENIITKPEEPQLDLFKKTKKGGEENGSEEKSKKESSEKENSKEESGKKEKTC